RGRAGSPPTGYCAIGASRSPTSRQTMVVRVCQLKPPGGERVVGVTLRVAWAPSCPPSWARGGTDTAAAGSLAPPRECAASQLRHSPGLAPVFPRVDRPRLGRYPLPLGILACCPRCGRP